MGLYLIDSTSIPNVNCFILYLHTWIAIHEPLDTWESLKLPPKNESSPMSLSLVEKQRNKTLRMFHVSHDWINSHPLWCWHHRRNAGPVVLLTLLQQDLPILHLQLSSHEVTWSRVPWYPLMSSHRQPWPWKVRESSEMVMFHKRLPDGIHFGGNRSTRSLRRVSTN